MLRSILARRRAAALLVLFLAVSRPWQVVSYLLDSDSFVRITWTELLAHPLRYLDPSTWLALPLIAVVVPFGLFVARLLRRDALAAPVLVFLAEPEPDLAVVPRDEAETADPHPGAAALVVEVAGDPLAYDRTLKATQYATAGITEYWIVNLAECSIEVYRDAVLACGRYQTAFTRHRGEQFQPLFAPSVVIEVSEIVG